MIKILSTLFLLSIPTAGVLAFSQLDNQQATCYVFKNNKLMNKADCFYNVKLGADLTPLSIFEATFTMKGYKNFSIVNNSSGDDFDKENNFINRKDIITLQGQKAITFFRDSKTYRVLSQEELGKRSDQFYDLGFRI